MCSNCGTLITLGRSMRIELSSEDAETLRELLREKLVELDKEINRTDSLAFKKRLQQLDHTIERLLAEVSSALESSFGAS